VLSRPLAVLVNSTLGAVNWYASIVPVVLPAVGRIRYVRRVTSVNLLLVVIPILGSVLKVTFALEGRFHPLGQLLHAPLELLVAQGQSVLRASSAQRRVHFTQYALLVIIVQAVLLGRLLAQQTLSITQLSRPAPLHVFPVHRGLLAEQGQYALRATRVPLLIHSTQSVLLVLSVRAERRDRRCVVLVPSIMQLVRLAHSLVDNVRREQLAAQGQYALRATRVPLPIHIPPYVPLVLSVRVGTRQRLLVPMGGLVILGRIVVPNVPWDMLVRQLQLVRALLAVSQLTERLHTMLIAKLPPAVHLISLRVGHVLL